MSRHAIAALNLIENFSIGHARIRHLAVSDQFVEENAIGPNIGFNREFPVDRRFGRRPFDRKLRSWIDRREIETE